MRKQPFISVKGFWVAFRTDASCRSLIISNFATIVIALLENWDVKTIMLIYVGQSFIIGFFNVLRMLNAQIVIAPKHAKTQPLLIAKIFLAAFFSVHYGLFNFSYLTFLNPFTKNMDWGWVIIALALFFAHHLYSFIISFQKERKNWDLAKLMMFPYFRIIPMHITIIFGGMFLFVVKNQLAEQIILIFFLLLKTNSDVKMHLWEHELSLPKPDKRL